MLEWYDGSAQGQELRRPTSYIQMHVFLHCLAIADPELHLANETEMLMDGRKRILVEPACASLCFANLGLPRVRSRQAFRLADSPIDATLSSWIVHVARSSEQAIIISRDPDWNHTQNSERPRGESVKLDRKNAPRRLVSSMYGF